MIEPTISSITYRMALEGLLSVCLNFLFCNLGITLVSTSQGDQEDEVSANKMLRMVQNKHSLVVTVINIIIKVEKKVFSKNIQFLLTVQMSDAENNTQNTNFKQTA